MPAETEYHCQEPRAKSQEPDSILKILICYHKPYTIPPLDDGIFLPVHAGKALSREELNIQTDDSLNGQPCDNISTKNDSYCELTVIYWAWKNLRKICPSVKYIGLMHYRRFFAFRLHTFLNPILPRPRTGISGFKVNPSEIISIIDSGYIIAPKPFTYPISLAMQYYSAYASEDYRVLREVIRQDFPEYYDDFIQVMEHSNKITSWNMFIMKYEDFDDYCRWIFSVLEKVEAQTPWVKHYNSRQKRLYGAMSERIFRVWLRHHNKKLRTCPVCLWTDDEVRKASFMKESVSLVLRTVRYLRNQLTAKLLLSGKKISRYA